MLRRRRGILAGVLSTAIVFVVGVAWASGFFGLVQGTGTAQEIDTVDWSQLDPCPPFGEPLTAHVLDQFGLDQPLFPNAFAATAGIRSITCHWDSLDLVALELHVSAAGEDEMDHWSVVFIGSEIDTRDVFSSRLDGVGQRLNELTGKPPYLRHEVGTHSLAGIDPRSNLAAIDWDADATVPLSELNWVEWTRAE